MGGVSSQEFLKIWGRKGAATGEVGWEARIPEAQKGCEHFRDVTRCVL